MRINLFPGAVRAATFTRMPKKDTETLTALTTLKNERQTAIIAPGHPHHIKPCAGMDLYGDTAQLLPQLKTLDQPVLLIVAHHSVAETIKLYLPEKTVLSTQIGPHCSLESSSFLRQVNSLRYDQPNLPIVSHLHCSVRTKMLSEVCCTAENAVQIVKKLGCPEVNMGTSAFLAAAVERATGVRAYTKPLSCTVQAPFSPWEVRRYRETYPKLHLLLHETGPAEVQPLADMQGSCHQILDYLDHLPTGSVVMVMTAEQVSNTLPVLYPKLHFIRPCDSCPSFHRVDDIQLLHLLENTPEPVTVPVEFQQTAARPITRMLEMLD